MGVIFSPQLLSVQHDVSRFDCGKATLNTWLQKRALKTIQAGGSARTYVACTEANQVIGYYALSTGSVERNSAPGKVRRNMPDPVPVVILGRLAVDQAYRGCGIGQGLLKDALMRVTAAADIIGIRAVLVHTLDETAKAFYKKHGFYESPTSELTLMVTIKEIQATLS